MIIQPSKMTKRASLIPFEELLPVSGRIPCECVEWSWTVVFGDEDIPRSGTGDDSVVVVTSCGNGKIKYAVVVV
jgi:hypothetical protein